MTNINWPLLTQTLDFVHKNPKLWDQQNWACGTTRCIAGHAAQFAGLIPEGHVIVDGGDIIPTRFIDLTTGSVDYMAYYNDDKCVDLRHVQDVAVNLGLPDADSEDEISLFSGENSWADVMRLVQDWADEDGVEIPEAWTSTEPHTPAEKGEEL